MYRIHFTAQDLARTRVAEAPMPLLELHLATRALQGRGEGARLDAWRRRTAAYLTAEERMVLAFTPAVGWSPTFLGPALAGTPEELLETARATPRRQIDAELADLAELQPTPSWARNLPDDAELQGRFFDGLHRLYARLLGPYWARLTDDFTADRTVRMRQFLHGGVESVLAHANPQWIRWTPPVLEVRMANGADLDMELTGQGVLLVPSLFVTRSIVDDEEQPQPIVTYPAGHDLPLNRLTMLAPDDDAAGPTVSAVASLLGGTRAAILTAVAEHPGCSTKELAVLARVAPASASEHATVLREAGLIHTVRYRNTALHSPTALGAGLLNQPRRDHHRPGVTLPAARQPTA
ncbi:MAG: helix-turn-helix domain-containing protein [Actinocatenispora sp.]